MFESFAKKIKNYQESAKKSSILKRNIAKKPRAKIADSLWKKTVIAFVFLTIGVFVFYFSLFRGISSGKFFKEEIVTEVAKPAIIKVDQLSSIVFLLRNNKEKVIDYVVDPIEYSLTVDNLEKNSISSTVLLEEKSILLE